MLNVIDNDVNALVRLLTRTSRPMSCGVVDAIAQGHRAALATLVEIGGRAARRLGAQMAIREDGGYCGYLSGGCVEAGVATEARKAIAAAGERTLLLGKGSPFFDLQLPCGGGITVAIHVLRTADEVAVHVR